MALEVTDGNISDVLTQNQITVLDFWAQWCGPCRMIGPVIDNLANENTDITIGKVNVDENSAITVQYGIRGIPAIIFFKDGNEVDRIVGVKSQAELQAKIDSLKP